MPGVGEKLRRAREAQDLSLDEIASSTRIGRAYLEALEEGRYEALPGRAFGKFYIRAYGDKLSFDPVELLQEYELELRSWSRPDETRDESDRPRRRRVGNAIATWREGLIAERERELAAARRGATAVEPELPDAVEERSDAVATEFPEPSPEAPASGDAANAAEVVEAPETAEAEAPVQVPGTAGSPPTQPTESTPGAARTEPAQAPGWVVGLAAAIILAVLLLIGTSLTQGNGDDPMRDAAPATRPRPSAESELPPEEPVERSAPTPIAAEPIPPADRPSTANPEGHRAPSAGLRVTEHGVGRRVVGNRLREPGDAFTAGDVVAFQTRVTGGRAGEIVRHVWLRDGRVQQSIPLRLGSASFRTHSTKTLWHPGNWVVEARDAAGNVIVSDRFVCQPR